MSFTIARGYVAKPPVASSSQQMTLIVQWIGKDAGPMVPVKTKEGLDLLNAVQKDIAARKVTAPLLKLGLDSGNLVLRVEGASNYVKTTILVKDYETLKTERAKGTVVNAHPGDHTVDESSDIIATARGTTAATAARVDLNAKGDTAPIVIVAHGSKTGNLPGTVYGTKFADKTPDEIVHFLVDNKKLALNYAGIIYLDGCYTAAGPRQGKDPSEARNFAKKVYDKLLSKGYRYLQVKGNLGVSATLDDGSETVMDAQAAAAYRIRLAELEKMRAELKVTSANIKSRIHKLEETAANLVARHAGNRAALAADLGVKLVREEVVRLEKERAAVKSQLAEWKAERNTIREGMEPGADFFEQDLVGVFGPAALASEDWYKKLFG